MSILQAAILLTECHMKDVTVTTQPFHTLIEFVLWEFWSKMVDD